MLEKFIKVLVIWLFSFFVVSCGVMAADPDPIDFTIIPEIKEESIDRLNVEIEEIWSVWWYVWDNYNDAADRIPTSEQIASWIMNWETILNYLVFVVQFLSQLWLAVGVLFIMYAWYKYMVSVFNGGKLPTETVKNAIIWVIVVIFSYAILKTMTSLIWIS